MPSRYSHLERRIAGEQQTFARPLRSLLGRTPVVCRASLPMSEAAALMRERSVGSVVVVDEAGLAEGIVTSHDLVQALAERAEARPVAEHMTRAPFALPAHALAYEAALAMVSRRIRHVLVIEEGALVGVISERDLFSLQRLGLGEVTAEIRIAHDIGMLAEIAREIRKLTTGLVDNGVAAEQLMALVSVLNDCLTHRVIEIVRKHHDLERISWCWLAFGSEGRLEQTYSSDQDNGLIFAPHEASAADGVRERLLPFAREVNEALDACGFPLCRGNIMASNPALCLSLQEWRSRMAHWAEVSSPQALLDASICFDFRSLYGDDSLAVELRGWLHALVRRHPLFLRHMAGNALRTAPALGIFGGFATGDGPGPGAGGTIDLKAHGARIFVDVARVFALAHAVPATATAERLRGASGAVGMGKSETGAALDAFFAIQSVRLRLQSRLHGAGEAQQNRIDPAQLGRIESTQLKEALRIARELQDRLALEYRL